MPTFILMTVSITHFYVCHLGKNKNSLKEKTLQLKVFFSLFVCLILFLEGCIFLFFFLFLFLFFLFFFSLFFFFFVFLFLFSFLFFFFFFFHVWVEGRAFNFRDPQQYEKIEVKRLLFLCH